MIMVHKPRERSPRCATAYDGCMYMYMYMYVHGLAALAYKTETYMYTYENLFCGLFVQLRETLHQWKQKLQTIDSAIIIMYNVMHDGTEASELHGLSVT